MASGKTRVIVDNLYPTATFEVKVTALSNDPKYSRILKNKSPVANSEDSDVIYCDTEVGSCTPKEKKCCF